MKLEEIIESVKSLFLFDDYQAMLEQAVARGAEIAGCERCCIIIENKRGELVLKAGHPNDGYAVGEKIDGARSIGLMRRIIKNEGVIWIDDPCSDLSSQYSNQSADLNKTATVVLMPLFCQGESLGLMVFDFTDGQKKTSARNLLDNIKVFAGFAAAAMKAQYQKRQHEESVLRKDHLSRIGENAAGIAHTIRNSATAIGLASARLDKKFPGGGPNDYTGIIAKEAERLMQISGDVLRYSRFSPDSFDMDRCDLNAFLVGVTDKFARVYEEQIEIAFQAAPAGSLPVRFDRRALEDCLHDLVSNAKEAGARRVDIRVKVNSKREQALIIISNDGEAIPLSVINKIFDPFVTTKPHGTGLGLANVRLIIAAHGGDIRVEGKEQTKFIISLPI